MRLKEYDNSDGRKVWLSHVETDQFLEHADSTEKKIAFGLMARCGLRCDEATSITPPDVVDTPVGPRVRVERGKGDKYREVPVPENLKTTMETFADLRPEAADVSLVDTSNRTVQRWVGHAADECRAESGDEGWRYLGPHDLRRSWGTQLVEASVEPGMIMEWGGWADWETFREHYLGAFSPEAEKREADKVPWL